MTFIRKIVALMSFCALAACAGSPDDCRPGGSSGSVLDVVLIVASLTCVAVTAAIDDEQDSTAARSDSTAGPPLSPAPVDERPGHDSR